MNPAHATARFLRHMRSGSAQGGGTVLRGFYAEGAGILVPEGQLINGFALLSNAVRARCGHLIDKYETARCTSSRIWFS